MQNDSIILTQADQRLLHCLRENARQSISDLARRLNVSRTTVQARLNRLEESGVIAGYSVVLGDAYRVRQLRAQILIVCAARQAGLIVAALRQMPEVREIHTVSGNYDLMLEIETESAPLLDARLDEIGALEGVERTMTLIILATKLSR